MGSFVTWLILAIVALPSCQKEVRDQSAPSGTDRMQSAAEIDTSYQITISSGGGFSGFTRGYTLFGNGRIEHWQRARAGKDTLLHATVVDPSEVARFRKELIQSGALQEVVNSTGNMTNRVVYVTADTTHKWMWGDENAGESVPKALLMWYDSVRKYCQDIIRKDD